MKVLKFGGTSVANSKSLKKVLEIIKNQNEQIIIVVSALGGITDLLMEMLSLAQSRKDNFKSNLALIEKRHLEPIKKCIPIQNQSSIISYLKKQTAGEHLDIFLNPKSNQKIILYFIKMFLLRKFLYLILII